MNVEQESDIYKEIEELISSDKSVVGIDAKKTHIVIIQLLREIMVKVDNLAARLEELEKKF